MTITHKGHPLFFVDQLSSHTWLPRLPQLFTDVLATASRPAAPPCTPRPVFTGATASIFPMALFLGGASHKALRQGAPASRTSATAPRPAASRWRSATAPRPATPPQRCPGQQHLRNGAPTSSTSATAPRPATNLTRRRKVLWFG